jgi:hypothetical protein
MNSRPSFFFLLALACLSSVVCSQGFGGFQLQRTSAAAGSFGGFSDSFKNEMAYLLG